MTKATKAEQAEYRAKLRDALKPGDTLYTVLRHRAPSGMSRGIDVYKFDEVDPVTGRLVKSWLSYWIAKAVDFRFDEKRECLTVGGAGMDMGFHVVYSLAAVLWPDGFDCPGDNCPSNDHVNDYRSPRGAGVHHGGGGYALRQEWL